MRIPTGIKILKELSTTFTLSSSVLAKILNLKRNTISEACSRLWSKGLIQKWIYQYEGKGRPNIEWGVIE